MTALSPIASLVAALTAQLPAAPPPRATEFLDVLTGIEVADEGSDGRAPLPKEKRAAERDLASVAWTAVLPIPPAEPAPPPRAIEMPAPVVDGPAAEGATAALPLSERMPETAPVVVEESDAAPRPAVGTASGPGPAPQAPAAVVPPVVLRPAVGTASGPGPAPQAPADIAPSVVPRPAVVAPKEVVAPDEPAALQAPAARHDGAPPPPIETAKAAPAKHESAKNEPTKGEAAKSESPRAVEWRDLEPPPAPVEPAPADSDNAEPAAAPVAEARRDRPHARVPIAPADGVSATDAPPQVEPAPAEHRPPAKDALPTPVRAAAQPPAPVETGPVPVSRAPVRAPLAFSARLTPTEPLSAAGESETVRPAERVAEANRRENRLTPVADDGPGRRSTPAPRPSRSESPERPVERAAPARDVAPASSLRVAEPADTAEAVAVEPKPEATKVVAARREMPQATPVARDIRLEVGSPEGKVEVRVVERAGEVRLAVRTPDNRLADGLREHLPLLSARLEQSGFRADEWRAAAAGSSERRLDVEAATSGSADARQQGHPHERGQERRDGEPRAPRDNEEQTRRNQEKGNPFAWLMESLR